MGTYKVPQNVEAEDKILGPLTLKQFIYAVIGIGYGFLTFAILQKAIVLWVLIGLPPMLAMLAMGLYQREDQPLETYVVAVLQFITRPKQRLWRKEPIAEVFHIEPPAPKPEPVKRDPREVRSQLQQLAELVDTRGWSVKRPELQEPEEVPVIDLRDRIGTSGLENQGIAPLEEAPPEVSRADDMLDAQNPASQNLNVLIQNTVKSVREEALEKMRQPSTSSSTPTAAPSKSTPPKTSAPASAAAATAQAPAQSTAATTPPSTSVMTAFPSDDILKLAAEGGDLTVAQIAAQAHKKQQTLAEGQTVSLRNG